MKNLPDTIDLEDMKSLVLHFPELLNSLVPDSNLMETCLSYYKEGVKGVCFIGMGGSSIVGQYAYELLNHKVQVPMTIVRDYQLPSFVSKEWVVIAVSYSGNTAETLSSLQQAEKRGSRIIIVTSGGKMEKDYGNTPRLLIHQGLQPRAALPLLLAGVLPITEQLNGIKPTSMKKIADSLSTASGAWGEWVPEPVSLAKVLLNKVPVFIGAEYMRTVAYRAKCQTNENAKTVAFCSEIPEAAHNEIEGLGSNALGDFIPVFLRFNNEDVRVTKTQDAMTSLYEESGLDPVSVHAVWDSQIMNMLAMTHYLDVVSVELAGLRGVNALAVEKIAELKKRQV